MDSHVGPYSILAKIGEGGMGEVYRAHDSKLGRDVAIKVLPRQDAEDPERRARLLREARAAAALNHPNICTIHDVGEASGRAYIAMEVVEGGPLSERLAEGPLSIRDVLRYGIQLAEALAHAHERGVVHRDFKSANVMLTPEGRVKVLDFGLAERLSGAAVAEVTTRSEVSLAHPRGLLGTLPYMSPEQLRGHAADARSDVWALGVVLYEMAAGKRPFGGQTGFELSSSILHDQPPPLASHIPIAFQTVVNRCLEKEPARRYQRSGEARAALEAVASGADTGVAALRASAGPSRRPLAVAVLAGVLLVVGAVAWLSAPAIRERLSGSTGPRIQSIAVLPLENLSGDPSEEYFVAGIHEALITDLSRIGLQKVIAKPSADAFRGTKKSLRDVGRELAVEGLVTGSVMRAAGRVQVTAQLVSADTGAVLWANRYERNAGDVLSLQNDIVGAIAREMRATLTPEQSARLATARPVNPAAHDVYLKGRSFFSTFANSNDPRQLDAAIGAFEESIKIDPSYARPYAALSNMYQTSSAISFLPPEVTMSKAKTAALEAVKLDDTLAEAHAALGGVALLYDWDWATAEREIQRALQLNPDSTDALAASEEYSVLIAGRFDEAARTSQRILEVDPLNTFARVQPVWVNFFSRRYDDSIRHGKSLVELYPNTPMGPFFLSLNYAVKHMAAEAAGQCGTLMRMLSGAYAIQPISTCVWVYGTIGQKDESQRLLQILEHPPAGVWLDPAIMVGAYAGAGDRKRALEWCEKGFLERSPNMIYSKASALWDPIRDDPRFQAVLRQMKFPG